MVGRELPLPTMSRLACKPLVHAVPKDWIDDSVVLAVMDMALVREPPGIDRVPKDLVEMPAAERLAAAGPACPIDATRHMDASGIELGLKGADAAKIEVAAEN